MQDGQTDELLPTLEERGELEAIDVPQQAEGAPEDPDSESEDDQIVD